MAKWLYIPVEVKIRELHAKLLFAKMAASAGYNVVIGRKAEVMNAVPYLPPGIFLGMWVQINFHNFYKKLKKRGFINIGMDEEGLVTFSEEMYSRFKMSSETLQYIDYFMAWGEHQRDIVKKFTDEEKIHVVGNLRFDVLRPPMQGMLKNEKDALQQKYGRYVLIMSSFGLANHCNGFDSYMLSLRKSKVIRDERDEMFLRRYADLQRFVCNDLKKSLVDICKLFPDINFIVRPHPGESLTAWDELKDIPNVTITNDGNVHSWIIGSECVVHHFCTTAVESFAAGVPSVAYRPAKDEGLESMVPYAGSLEAVNTNELLVCLKNIIGGDKSAWNNKYGLAETYLKHHLENISGTYCFQRMLSVIAQSSPPDVSGRTRLCAYVIRQNIMDILRAVKKTIFGSVSDYIDQKFGNLTTKEIDGILSQIHTHGSIKTKRISNMCFLITANTK